MYGNHYLKRAVVQGSEDAPSSCPGCECDQSKSLYFHGALE